MDGGPLHTAMRHLRRAAMLREGGATDGQLLESFVARRDEASFEGLVRRHGPMVLGVCRRVLANTHDAEDAFQATFVVLVRRAASIRPREKVGAWLYGVAYRTALQARTAAASRRAKERRTAKPEAREEEVASDLLPLLDQELSRLPEKYRAPIVLCELEGKTHQEAARRLGWPVGTVSGRLSRAAALLSRRLARYAPALPAGALTTVLPTALTGATVRTLAVGAAAPVAVLVKGALRAMMLSKIKIGATALLAAVLATLAVVGTVAWRAEAEDPGRPIAQNPAPADPGKGPAKPPEETMHGLKLTLSADKTEAKLLPDGSNIEPIRLKLTFANVGREPLTLDMSPAAWYVGTSITVIGPDGGRAPYGRFTDLSPLVHPGVRQARAEDFHLLAPGDEWARTIDFPISSDELLPRGHLTKPGDYHILAVYEANHAADDPLAKGSWNGTVKSEDFVLKVVADDGFGPEVNGLKARVLLAKATIPVGEPVQAKYCVKNVSKGEQLIWNSGFWPNHQIIVRDADGKEPPLNAAGAAGRKAFSPGGDRFKNISVKLAPGAEDDTEGAYDLTWVYDLSKPGRYTVQYVYEEKQGGWEGRLPSNEAAFEIVKNSNP